MLPRKALTIGQGMEIAQAFGIDLRLEKGRLREFLGWSDMANVGFPNAPLGKFIKDGKWDLPDTSSAQGSSLWSIIQRKELPSMALMIKSFGQGPPMVISLSSLHGNSSDPVTRLRCGLSYCSSLLISPNIVVVTHRQSRIDYLQETDCWPWVSTLFFLPLCGVAVESIDRLYFKCSYTAYIWKIWRLKFGLRSRMLCDLHKELEDLRKRFNGNNQVHRLAMLVIGAVVWCIWRERNNRAFENFKVHKGQLIKEVIDIVHP